MNMKSIKTSTCIAGFLAILATASTAQTTWYLKTDNGANGYNTASYWNAVADGTGAAATVMDGNAIYDTNGKAVRTTQAPRSEFLGGTLLLNRSEFSLKAVATDVRNLTTASTGADIINAWYNPSGQTQIGDMTLRIAGTFALNGHTGLFSSTGRTITLEAGTLAGTGNLLVGGARQINSGNLVSTVTLKATDATAYTGDIVVAYAGTTLSFGDNFVSGGGLRLESGARLNLATSLSFAGGIYLDGQAVALTDGSYDYAALLQVNAAFANFIIDQGGRITVGTIPEPSAVALLTALAALGSSMIVRRHRCDACPRVSGNLQTRDYEA
ncbi:hypothetical protein OpiT1DRAFT_04198 [Opitutaceae bacterium TAV1]|nr:hypothetical protein OpiT1DRAFT_04198 [Opitutaceae bacterium TAV1]